MKYRLKFIFLAVTTFIQACSTQTALTIYTNPIGGYVTEHQTGLVAGISPVTLYFDHAVFAQYKTSDGCFLAKGVEVTWVSGAKATLAPIKLCGSKWEDYTVTVDRPNAEGLEEDLKFALQVQSMLAQQQQAQAAQNSYLLQLYNSSKSTNCVSRKGYGDNETIYTKCK